MHVKIATFNANSIRQREPVILEWLELHQPDLVAVQETKVQDKDFPADPFANLGYEVAFRGQKSYNGVALISKHPLEEIRSGLYEAPDEQARFVSASVMGIPVINVYVPQGFAPGTEKFEYKLGWLKDLIEYLKEIYDPTQPLLIAGDFNVALEDRDVYDPEAFRGGAGFHPDEQVLMRQILEWGLEDVFRKHESEGEHYTFWDYRIPNALKRKMGWRIDYILATFPLAEKSKKIWIDTNARTLKKPSDHTFLIAEFE